MKNVTWDGCSTVVLWVSFSYWKQPGAFMISWWISGFQQWQPVTWVCSNSNVEIVGFGVGLMSRLHTRRLRRFQFYRHDWALGRLYMCCRLGRQRGRAGGSRGGCEQRWTKVSCNCKLTMVITIMLMMAMCEQRWVQEGDVDNCDWNRGKETD